MVGVGRYEVKGRIYVQRGQNFLNHVVPYVMGNQRSLGKFLLGELNDILFVYKNHSSH